MKQHWFIMTDKGLYDFSKVIPDGSRKQDALNKARKWIKDNGIKTAILIKSSIRSNKTENEILIE